MRFYVFLVVIGGVARFDKTTFPNNLGWPGVPIKADVAQNVTIAFYIILYSLGPIALSEKVIFIFLFHMLP